MIHRVETPLPGLPMTLETGRIAKQAHGAVVVTQGDNQVLVTAVMGPARNAPFDDDFIPLTVDYRERTAAAGKFPGGFYKRESRPRDKEILTCRLMDRPLRPLFADGLKDEILIQALVFSADGEIDSDILAMNGASAALMVSGIPFKRAVGSVRVGRIKGQLVLNPTVSDLAHSSIDLVVSGTLESVIMVEGAAREESEEVIVEAIRFAYGYCRELAQSQMNLKELVGKPDIKFEVDLPAQELYDRVSKRSLSEIKTRLSTVGKKAREQAISELKKKVVEEFVSEVAPELDTERDRRKRHVKRCLSRVEEVAVRTMAIDNRRQDGRALDEIRPISCEVGFLPRCHGSALFTRGETQALVTVTLGTPSDEQTVDGLMEEYSKKFMLHYNFPSFSVGEVKPPRGPGRREIGHGQLAERALESVLPAEEHFPYTVRVVSDIMESNGSSSMASVCGGTLACFDAGVPLRAPVAGIAMGLVVEGNDVRILSDILGSEDKYGDMDFKVAGTRKGVTAVQMDMKSEGISPDLMSKALEQARAGRLHILKEMEKTIADARKDLSQYAPRIIQIKINPAKIGAVIGPGGKMIRKIEEQSGATIEIEDDGTITLSGVGAETTAKARRLIEGLTEEIVVGKIYDGRICSIRDFGAFVEIPGGNEGLCHISELADGYTAKVTDVVQVGAEVKVKVLNIDDAGKIRLSRRAAIRDLQGPPAPGAPPGPPSGPPPGPPAMPRPPMRPAEESYPK